MILLISVFSAPKTISASETVYDNSGKLTFSSIGSTENSDCIFGSALPSQPSLGSNLKLSNDLVIKPDDSVTLKLRLNYLINTLQDSNDNNKLTLSRGYLDFSPSPRFNLRFGKQRLAWGTGYAWNPVNILDWPRNAFTDSDDPEGIIALRSDLYLGPVTTQIILKPSDSWESSDRVIRFKLNPSGFDLAYGLIQNHAGQIDQIFDFAHSISGIGIHGEAFYQAEGNWRTDKKDIFNYLLGADYNFPGGYYLAFEYYHNDGAFKDVPELLGYIGTNHLDPLATNELITNLSNNGGITRDHLFLRGMKTIGENLNTQLVLIYNPSDKSMIIQPQLEYTWRQATTLFFKLLYLNGDINSEANLSPFKSQFEFGIKVNY
jgi:hypothetical protein